MPLSGWPAAPRAGIVTNEARSHRRGMGHTKGRGPRMAKSPTPLPGAFKGSPPKGIPPRAIAPGSVPKAPAAPGSLPRLNPQPKPIGPAKGGPPPIGTKPPSPNRPGAPAKKGEGTFLGKPLDGHAQKRHGPGVTNTQLAGRLDPKKPMNPEGTPAKKPIGVATAPNSKADQTRINRIIGKSPAMQAANAAAAKGPVQTKPTMVTVPVPTNRNPPMLRVARPGPGGSVSHTTEPAKSIKVAVQKTPAGVIHKTVFGEPGKK